jgi:phage terminase small subunit
MNESNVFESLKAFTDKQQKWFWEYLKCFNAAKAAEKAGYENPKQSGWENKQVMRPLIDAYLESAAMGSKESLELIQQHATLNIFNAKQDIEEHGHLIKKLKYDKEGNLIEIEIANYDAAALLAKIHGLTSAKKQEGNTGKLNEWLEQIKEAREKYGSE